MPTIQNKGLDAAYWAERQSAVLADLAATVSGTHRDRQRDALVLTRYLD